MSDIPQQQNEVTKKGETVVATAATVTTTAPPTAEAGPAPNKKSRKREQNPDAGLGTQRPAKSRHAAAEENGPSKCFCGVSERYERRLYATFKSRKQQWMAEIAKHSAPIDSRDEADKSNKGFIDTRCLPIMAILNAHPDYVTTSSCSGRICLFHTVGALNGEDDAPREGEEQAGGSSNDMKRGGEGSLGWILASHESPLTEDQIQLVLRHTVPNHGTGTATVEEASKDVNGCMVTDCIPTKGQVSFRCEPFLLHVQCRTIEAAKKLLNAASEAGFRNSGMLPPGRHIMVNIRHASLSIDAPVVADGGISFASEAHIRYLVKVAEEKMAENFRRTVMLEKAIARWVSEDAPKEDTQ